MKRTTPNHPDAPLLKACVAVAVALRGASGAYEADTTGDSDFANAIDPELLGQATKALATATNYLPSTFDGLSAKAAIVDMTFDLLPNGVARKFLLSFTSDVARFHKATENTTAEVAL